VKPQAEVEFFDRFAESHEEYDVLGEGAYERLLGEFSLLCKPGGGEVCVDCGCGTGAFTRRLRKFNLQLTGVDISPKSIRSAQSRSGGENYVVGDIRRLEMADGSVDIAVFSGVLHHFPGAEPRGELLREAFRVLKPGGRVFGFDPSAHSPSMWLYRSPASPLYSDVGKTENEVLLTRQQLETELREAGFEGIRVGGAGGITYRYVEGRVARAFLPVYNIYEKLLRMSPLEARLGTFLISFGRKSQNR
jgi:ubiquinone/menaquinone biosynthesis C-methylase UbiE